MGGDLLGIQWIYTIYHAITACCIQLSALCRVRKVFSIDAKPKPIMSLCCDQPSLCHLWVSITGFAICCPNILSSVLEYQTNFTWLVVMSLSWAGLSNSSSWRIFSSAWLKLDRDLFHSARKKKFARKLANRHFLSLRYFYLISPVFSLYLCFV